MTSPQLNALRLLGRHTGNTFRIWDLAGPSKAHIRADILTTARLHRVSKCKAGISELEREFFPLARLTGPDAAPENKDACVAVILDRFAEWAKEMTKEVVA